MNKFWAKLKLKSEKNVGHLVKAFFRDFNPEISIVLRGNEAKLEIFFEKPPMEIIDSMTFCEIEELNYGKNLQKYEDSSNVEDDYLNNPEQIEETEAEEADSGKVKEIEAEEADSEEVKETEAEEADSEEVKETEAEEADSEEVKETEAEEADSEEVKETEAEEADSKEAKETEAEEAEKTKKEEEKILIPELEELAKKATSFEHFVKMASEWLEMEKRPDSQKFFEELVIASIKVDTVNWKELKNALAENNVKYGEWAKIQASKMVSEKLKDYSVTILPFVAIMREYKDYSFITKEIKTETNVEENVVKEENIQEVEIESELYIPKPRVKMDCMPEIKEFEEILGSVDMTQPVEARVRYVLEAMGLENLCAKDQRQILEIAVTAVKKGRIAFDIIFVEAKIPIEHTMTARMTFAGFVNNFAQKHESNKRVKLLDFLSELQKIIMFESEIEDFSDFDV